jgi:hypothetical protein
MSNAVTGNKEKSKIFETVFRSPGMSEKCKVSMHISRQNIILLGRLIEYGVLSEKNSFTDEILSALPKESLEDFKMLKEEMLKKADLTEFYELLKTL